MRKDNTIIDGGLVVNTRRSDRRFLGLCALMLIVAALPLSAWAQGSIYGTVQNSDLSTPANGEISFVGFLDDTDEEIRIETSTGAGYDAGNWFDDFQNYLTEAPGNPYDHYFYNVTNGQGFHLAGTIPNNSFQQEDIVLAAVAWPVQPTGLIGTPVASGSIVVSWNYVAGLTYHVYRRPATSSGSFFRIDNVAGLLADPGVADSFFVDNGVDGVSSYDYVIIAQDGSANYSQHSSIATVNSSTLMAPIVTSVDPASGLSLGGTFVTVYGSGFDLSGVGVVVGSASLTGITVVSPFRITGTTQAGTPGPADVTVANTLSALASTLVGGYTYTSNAYPVLAAIGPQSVSEGAPLSFVATATDTDGGNPVMTSSTLPAGATYVDNGNGTGSFDWTPTFFDNGTYNVTFYATDDIESGLVDSEQVVITVIEAGNQLPVLAAIGAQGTTENIAMAFSISATDIESTPVLTTSTLPTGATFLDNGDGSGDFNWTPDFTQAAAYDVTFYATDDSLAVDSEIVTITVIEAGNQSPVLATIGAQGTNEEVPLSFGVSATDPDGDTPLLTTSTLPTGAVFNDAGDGTGTFDWTPDFTQAGSYDVTFYAGDGALLDSEVVTITVAEAGNQSPVLAAIGAQNTTEDVLLSFGVSATDPDGDTPLLTTSTLPTGAVFNDAGDGTGAFDWTPDFTQAGAHSVTFYASDGALLDSEVVTITVAEAGNQSPVLAAIGPQGGPEGVLLTFGIIATDPDGDTPTLTTSALPGSAGFADASDGTGTFEWTPGFTDAGTYSVTFYAGDGALVDSEVVTITVTDAGNQEPVLAAIGAQATDENVLLTFALSAGDPDGDIPVLSTSTLPAGAAFVDNLDGTGAFDWTPSYADSGTYDVTFYATDGAVPSSIDSEIVTITVNNVNQLVSLTAVGDQAVAETANLNLIINAVDPDGDVPIMTSSVLPGTATLIDNLDGSATFDWTPTYDDSGTYLVTFYATDGSFPAAVDSETITITVANTNRAPILAAIGQQIGVENVNLTFGVTAADDDGDLPLLSTTVLPGTATFVDNLDGTGTFDWTPTVADSGTYDVTFYAVDGVYPADADSEVVTIIVGDDNQLPVLAAIGDQVATEGVLLSFGLSASDPDGTFPILSAAPLPAGATVTDNGDGTGSFDWTPDFSSAGPHVIAFYATDAGYPTVVDSETITITVGEAGNQAPQFLTIAAQNSPEGTPISFTVTADDPDGDIPILWASVLPTGATFVDNLDGTGTFDLTPDYTQAGDYLVTFYADDGEFIDSTQVSITVSDAGNQPPVMAPVALQAAVEGGLLSFTVTGSDPDLTVPVLTTSVLPAGATFVDNTDGTGTFEWTPDFTQVGSYDIMFYADDGEFLDSTGTTITVADNLAAPTLDPIGPQVGSEGVMLTIPISGSDPDSTFPTLSAAPLPAGASIVDNLDGTALFSWLPAFDQAGDHDVTFSASDGELTATELVTFSITEAGDQPPMIDSIADTTILEGTVLVVNVSGYDPEGLSIALNASTTLNHYTFIDNHDGTGVLTYSPDFFDAGTDTIRIFATEIGGSGLAAMELFVITTVDVNRPPVFEPVGPFNMVVFDTLQFDVIVSDTTDPNPNAIVFLPTDGLPTHATFVDNGNNSGTFTFAPDYGEDGLYTVTFWAVDQGNPPMSSSLPVDITVQTTNLPPQMTPIGPQSLTEGETLTLLLSATDADGGMPPTLLVGSLVENAAFVDSGNGFGSYTFSPSFVQSGLYSIRFGATDGIDSTWLSPVLIQVLEAGNQAPVFDQVPLDSITENLVLEGFVAAHDPDMAPITLTVDAGTTPENFTFVDSGNGVAGFTFSPDFSQAGTYDITVIASDGELETSATMTLIAIEAGNQLPVLDTILDYSVSENALLQFTVTASDVDGPPPLLSTSTLPGSASFDSPTGLFSWTPTFNDSGNYVITFYATDADDPLIVDSQHVNITVIDFNRQPWLLIPPVYRDTVSEGQTLTFGLMGWDDDGTIPELEAFLDGTDSLAANMSFATEVVGNTREGTLTFSPDYTQGGVPPVFYFVRFRVVDEADPTLFRVSGSVSFRVKQVNLPPYMNFQLGPGPFEITEDQTLAFNVQAVDPDGTIPTLRVENLPDSNYTLSQPSANVALFSFRPSFTQAGLYQISFIAEDDSLAADTQVVEINVLDAGNHPPAFASVLPDTISVYTAIQFAASVEAFDPEGDAFVLEALGLPPNSTWDTTGGVGSFVFTPDVDQVDSIYQVQFVATDVAAASDTMVCHFVVGSFLRGDTDANAKYTINDIIFLAAYMFRGGAEPAPIESADTDGSGEVNVADLAYMVNYMYHAGPRPPQ
ncbi:MAG: Ig-like domain-containing protein [bacterium]